MAATESKLAEKVDDAARAVKAKTMEKSRHAADDVKKKIEAAKGAVRERAEHAADAVKNKAQDA